MIPFCNISAAVIAIVTGILTTLGLFNTVVPEVIAALMLQFVAVTAGIAILMGVANLFAVHFGRLIRIEPGSPYSLVVIISAVAVIVLRILNPRTTDTDEPISLMVFEAVQVSLESALAGLICFFLVFAAYRMLQDRVSWEHLLFVGTLLIVLVGWLPLAGLDALHSLREWVLTVPVAAGARGILIGVALGTITVGLRVLIGQEEAYREQ